MSLQNAISAAVGVEIFEIIRHDFDFIFKLYFLSWFNALFPNTDFLAPFQKIF